jgi:hypothetical protein
LSGGYAATDEPKLKGRLLMVLTDVRSIRKAVRANALNGGDYVVARLGNFIDSKTSLESHRIIDARMRAGKLEVKTLASGKWFPAEKVFTI